jgi:SAM-dependent methyltransferase
MKTKETQGKLWSTAPQDWANHWEPTFIPLYKAVLKQINVNEETVLLDAGCGSGLFLSMVSATGAKIYGIDAAPGLIHITQQRVPEATLMIEDLEEIPFGKNSFDVVTGFNSFQYAGDKLAALNQAKSVVREGGKIVVGIWDEAANCDSSIIFSTLGKLLTPPPPDAPGPFALSAEGRVESMAKELKLSVVHKEKIHCPLLFTNLEDLFKAFMSTGPAVKASETLGVEKVKEIIKSSSEPFRIAEEVYFMSNYFNFFVLQK